MTKKIGLKYIFRVIVGINSLFFLVVLFVVAVSASLKKVDTFDVMINIPDSKVE